MSEFWKYLVGSCWDQQPAARPTFTQLMGSMQRYRQDNKGNNCLFWGEFKFNLFLGPLDDDYLMTVPCRNNREGEQPQPRPQVSFSPFLCSFSPPTTTFF